MDHKQATVAGAETQSIFTRHRFEPKRRTLKITGKDYITPKMIRITAVGAELADFISKSPDDHIKLIVGMNGDKPEMRDYTPRYYNVEQKQIIIDFAVHEAGPATQWAIDAQVGDDLRIAGPRGSGELTEAFDWIMLIGDETALPAMGRWLDESPDGQQFLTLGIVTSQAEEQTWDTKANHQAFWAHRASNMDSNADAALSTLSAINRPEGKGFIWIAAEASVARALKAHVLDVWNHPTNHVKSSGYWVKGLADTTEK